MQITFRNLFVSLTLTAVAAFGQARPAFEVATVKPAAPLDQAKMMAAMQGGGKMPVGATIDNKRAEYTYLDMKTLMSYAYGVKPFQITGPDWMGTTRFDIVAKLPEGATKADAPKMLQTLLEDRFKLTVHKTMAEHPVLALVAGKGPTKLKASEGKPVAIDENAPLRTGEMKMDGPDGPIRMSIVPGSGAEINMGLLGKMTYKVVPATQSMRIEMSMVTMKGFADMMTQMLSQFGGGQGPRLVDMTGIEGNYEASLDFSLADIMTMARNAGMEIPGGAPPAGGAGATPTASDPSGAQTLTGAVAALGLKLESRKAMVEQLVVDHVEKTPTDN